MPMAGLAYALCAVMIWTGFILVSKAGALAALATPDLIMVRFGTAFVLFSPFIWRHRKVICQWRMAVLGSIGGLAYAFRSLRDRAQCGEWSGEQSSMLVRRPYPEAIHHISMR